jgi:hypothetical protein
MELTAAGTVPESHLNATPDSLLIPLPKKRKPLNRCKHTTFFESCIHVLWLDAAYIAA